MLFSDYFLVFKQGPGDSPASYCTENVLDGFLNSVHFLVWKLAIITAFSFVIQNKVVLHNTPLFQLNQSVHILVSSLLPVLYCRNIVMAYTNHYNMMLGVQVLHCFDFALLWSAMMDFVHDISPPSIKVTMNVVLQSVHFGKYSIWIYQ